VVPAGIRIVFGIDHFHRSNLWTLETEADTVVRLDPIVALTAIVMEIEASLTGP
jgi:hypothetical protein